MKKVIVEDSMYRQLDIKERIKGIQCKICYYRYMAVSSRCYYRKKHYIKLMNSEVKKLRKLLNKRYGTDNKEVNLSRQREFTLDQLSQYDGSRGKPAYIAVNGIVYDVSMNIAWGGGTHFGLYAGKDLTSQFAGCHRANSVILNKLPQIGILKI